MILLCLQLSLLPLSTPPPKKTINAALKMSKLCIFVLTLINSPCLINYTNYMMTCRN